MVFASLDHRLPSEPPSGRQYSALSLENTSQDFPDTSLRNNVNAGPKHAPQRDRLLNPLAPLPMKISFANLFDDELRALNRAETKHAVALRWMAKTATHSDLHTCFTQRLERCGTNIGSIIDAQRACRYVPPWRERDLSEILTADGDGVIDFTASPLIIDLALIADAHRMTHYLLARYGSAARYAAKLRDTAAAKALKSILLEEEKYEKSLTGIWKKIARRTARETAASLT